MISAIKYILLHKIRELQNIITGKASPFIALGNFLGTLNAAQYKESNYLL